MSDSDVSSASFHPLCLRTRKSLSSGSHSRATDQHLGAGGFSGMGSPKQEWGQGEGVRKSMKSRTGCITKITAVGRGLCCL